MRDGPRRAVCRSSASATATRSWPMRSAATWPERRRAGDRLVPGRQRRARRDRRGPVDAVALRRRHACRPGRVELARSDVGPQAWRMGRSFCTQFHPEANETMIRRWATSDGGTAELLKFGIKPDQLVEDSRRNVAESQPAADHLVDWFLDRVAGSMYVAASAPMVSSSSLSWSSPMAPMPSATWWKCLRSNAAPMRCRALVPGHRATPAPRPCRRSPDRACRGSDRPPIAGSRRRDRCARAGTAAPCPSASAHPGGTARCWGSASRNASRCRRHTRAARNDWPASHPNSYAGSSRYPSSCISRSAYSAQPSP